MKPSLSLIVSTYNRSQQLLVTLRSIAAQTAPAAQWECVVVDNNSTDDTAVQVEAFRAAHPDVPLRYLFERRQGLSWARNRGIAESAGGVIAVIDDDERIVPGFVSAYIDFFAAHPDVAAAGGAIIAEYPSGRPDWMSPYTERPIANPIDLGPRPRPFPRGRIPGGGNMALQRWAVERYGAFDPSLGRRGGVLLGGEECELFERLARGGERCWYVPDAVMYHIIPPSKLSRDYFDRLCFNIGVSQRTRAAMRGGIGRMWCAEALKWGATALLAAAYCLTGRGARAVWLVRMRRRIAAGIRNGSQKKQAGT
ncbi:glycosyltransferase family 2 protein [uncultured Alistipes sp.]|uniref:glycosyltransferase n=1 Tax=uncultured Alistipes sp. TaxID=538949 RepID=UPI0026053DEC|nr:glycosyltransferase family 2 protein [uncultured Alistipes sp.]